MNIKYYVHKLEFEESFESKKWLGPTMTDWLTELLNEGQPDS